MKPIPKKLLIHSAAYRSQPQDAGAWGEAIWTDTQLDFVRFEPTSRLIRTKENTEVQQTGLLLIDAVFSTPLGLNFMGAEGNKIIFDGRTYTIIIVDPMTADCKFHHWELGLA